LKIDACDREPPIVDVDLRKVRCWRAKEQSSPAPIVHESLPERSTSGPTILEVVNLSAYYDGTEVLHQVNLNVPTGVCAAVVGESGSGKTTLARCIVGLHKALTGELTFDGTELGVGWREREKESLRQIQYIFQNPYTALNPRKTIGQIVSQPLEHFFALARSERDDRVRTMLEDVSLSGRFLNRYPDQLSGGERQRVAIARALVVMPDLLVCDEVTSALDVSVQAAIVELLRDLQRERQLSMLFITHNLALVRSIAQSVVVLSHGRVVEAGAVTEVLEHPTDSYTIQLMENVPRLAPTSSN
jgi:peptide/nickel transport system ATP-binding protein